LEARTTGIKDRTIAFFQKITGFRINTPFKGNQIHPAERRKANHIPEGIASSLPGLSQNGC
jgi:hypothetical protein